MAKLEIRTPDGRSEIRRISRRNPILVGRNPISDVPIEDDSIAPIHCRLSWNGSAYEIAAVASDGVDVNGVLVRRKELTDGDVVRVGDVDLTFLRKIRQTSRATAGAAVDDQPAPQIEDDDAELLDIDEEPSSGGPWTPAPPGEIEMPLMEASSAPERGHEALAIDDEPVLLDEPVLQPTPPAERPPSAGLPSPSVGVSGRLRSTKRPGEQDVFASPLVLGFGGLALALLLAAGAIWLLIGREGANRLHATATEDREAGRYSQAISGYERFLVDYPSDHRSGSVRYALAETRVERFAAGSTPDWNRALAEFDRLVQENRDDANFDSRRPALRRLAQTISSGAAAAAVRTGDRELLEPARQARRLFDRYAPTGDSTEEAVANASRTLDAGFAAAEAAVRKREYVDTATQRIEDAIAKGDFPTVYDVRSDLLTRYPDLGTDRRVRAALAKALDAEKTLIQAVDAASEGHQRDIRTDHKAGASRSPITLIAHTQARAGEVGDGRLVFAVARHVLTGLDAVTGRPKWRRTIGLDTPFFPLETYASVPALLAFDATRNDLLLLRRDDGEPLWRTSVGAAVTGPPRIDQGQIDVATSEGRLMRFDLETGRLIAAIAFPQPVIGPPVAVDQNRLVVFGDRATAYTLDRRSLAVAGISFVGHSAGSIDVPPQALGRLMTTYENDRLDSALVRVFEFDSASGTLKQVAAERVDGQILQSPVARGNMLFVPSSPERITALSVSDNAGQPPLTRLAGTQISGPKDVPLYLVPGPDGMLWAAGSALRKLRLTAEGLELMKGSLAPGRHTQPPQQSGESLFVARSLPSAPAVYLSQADREAMVGSWRTVLGAAPVAVAAGDRDATVVTEAGGTASLSADLSKQAGFLDTRPLPQWDEASSEPLHGATFSDGRAIAWRGGTTPMLWVVAPDTSPDVPKVLPAMPECPPVPLDGGLVLPLPGRLEWLTTAGGAQKVEPFQQPVTRDGDASPRWKSLVALDGERLAAVDDAGTLRVVGLRREPLPHLAEFAAVSDESVTRPLVSIAGRIVVVAGDRIRLLDPAGLRPIADARLDSVPTGGPWSVDAMVFVEAGKGRIAAFDGQSLDELWRVELDAPAAGGPIRVDDGWLAASQTGMVVDLAEDGTERGRISLEEPLMHLVRIGDVVLAAALDGSFLSFRPDADERSTDMPKKEESASTDGGSGAAE